MSKLNDNSFFSILGFSDAFMQIKIERIFETLHQLLLFKFKRLPFGITTAPTIFQQAMDRTLSGLIRVHAYIDE